MHKFRRAARISCFTRCPRPYSGGRSFGRILEPGDCRRTARDGWTYCLEAEEGAHVVDGEEAGDALRAIDRSTGHRHGSRDLPGWLRTGTPGVLSEQHRQEPGRLP